MRFGLLLISFLFLHQSALAKQLYGFKNFSINYLNWSDKTESGTNYSKADFYYLELEGGAGYDWGDIYGFLDLENPFKSSSSFPNNRRTALKFTVEPNLGNTNFNFYLSVYNFSEKSFNEQNRVYGISYNLNSSFGLVFKPFIGVHDITTTYFSGINGVMAGWVLLYNFNISKQKFSVSNWNEIEFAREPEYLSGERQGLNGAVALWWHANKLLTAGFQYRYANNKLGSATYQDGGIISLKFHF